MNSLACVISNGDVVKSYRVFAHWSRRFKLEYFFSPLGRVRNSLKSFYEKRKFFTLFSFISFMLCIKNILDKFSDVVSFFFLIVSVECSHKKNVQLHFHLLVMQSFHRARILAPISSSDWVEKKESSKSCPIAAEIFCSLFCTRDSLRNLVSFLSKFMLVDWFDRLWTRKFWFNRVSCRRALHVKLKTPLFLIRTTAILLSKYEKFPWTRTHLQEEKCLKIFFFLLIAFHLYRDQSYDGRKCA